MYTLKLKINKQRVANDKNNDKNYFLTLIDKNYFVTLIDKNRDIVVGFDLFLLDVAFLKYKNLNQSLNSILLNWS